MGLTTIKFTLTHPAGLAVIRFRVNYQELNQAEIYAFQTASSPNIIVEGTLSLNIVTSKVNIEWEAVGQPYLAGTVAVKYKDKDLLKATQGDLLIDTNGRMDKVLTGISLNP